MTTFFFLELATFLRTETVDHLYVNTTRAEKLSVKFDFTFPNIPCNILTIDAADELGMKQEHAVHAIYKHSISPSGEVSKEREKVAKIGEGITSEEDFKKTLEEQSVANKPSGKECGSCHGAGPPNMCCNTCDDVRKAYKKSGWRFNPAGIEQCEKENELETTRSESAIQGGCQIYGDLELNKAAGQILVTPHKTISSQNGGTDKGVQDFMELIQMAFAQFNITHTINSLSFGHQFPGLSNPLDGSYRRVKDTHGMYQYYVKIVPTVYQTLKGKEIESNQYAVTEHLRHLSPGSGRGMPGLYFNYELSPIQAKFEERRNQGGFLRFLTSVCAIVGGSFTMFGIVDGFIGGLFKVFGKQLLQ
jgi:hypothetical protein